MSSFRYVRCSLAGVYGVRGGAGNCYDNSVYELPDGRVIEFRGGRVYIDGKRVEYDYRGSFLYSNRIEKPLVPMLFIYSVDGIIIPEEEFAFFHVNSPMGPMTVVMYGWGTFVGIDTIATVSSASESFDPSKSYIVQFISDVEKAYFGRDEFERYVRGVL